MFDAMAANHSGIVAISISKAASWRLLMTMPVSNRLRTVDHVRNLRDSVGSIDREVT
jgi:hypothetical protein